MNKILKGTLIAGGILGAFIGYDAVRLAAIDANKPISQIACADVSEVVKGLQLKNAFGATFSVIRISDQTETSRTTKAVVCSAQVTLDNGSTGPFTLKVEEIDSEHFYSISEI